MGKTVAPPSSTSVTSTSTSVRRCSVASSSLKVVAVPTTMNSLRSESMALRERASVLLFAAISTRMRLEGAELENLESRSCSRGNVPLT